MRKKLITILLFILVAVSSYHMGVHQTMEKSIPINDIACYFINDYDYPCFELKDYGNQLDNPHNRSYEDIMKELQNVTEEYEQNNIIY